MEIVLSPFTKEDFDRLISWVPTEEFLMVWSGPFFTFPLNDTQLNTYLDSSLGPSPIRKIYKAVDKGGGDVIGHIELNNIAYRNSSASISKVLVGLPQKRGGGIGTQMVRQLLPIAFNELKLHRLYLYVFDFNSPALSCYRKLGFHQEGHIRDFRKVGERYWSSYLMSLLDYEWAQMNREGCTENANDTGN